MTKDYGDGRLRWTGGPGRGGRFAPKNQAGVTGGADTHRRGTKARPAPKPVPVAAPAGPVKTPSPQRLRRATDAQLTEWFHQLSAREPGTQGLDDALTALFAELGRREGGDQGVRDDHHTRQIDDLMRRGWSYLDAYAEVTGRNVEDLRAEERMAAVERERRPGERRATTIRRMYAEHVAMSLMQAEEDTNGVLLSKAGMAENNRRRRKGNLGIDPASLWYGNPNAARKYASDELKAWWASHGGRPTATSFAAQFTGDRKALERQRLSGQGKDFGV